MRQCGKQCETVRETERDSAGDRARQCGRQSETVRETERDSARVYLAEFDRLPLESQHRRHHLLDLAFRT